MRKVADWLMVIAAVLFLFGVLASLFSSAFLPWLTRGVFPAFGAETFWRGSISMLLFALTLLVRERGRSAG